jgi:hypothetical protein
MLIAYSLQLIALTFRTKNENEAILQKTNNEYPKLAQTQKGFVKKGFFKIDVFTKRLLSVRPLSSPFSLFPPP